MSDNPPVTRKEAERAAAALLQQQLLGPINDLHDARQHAEKDHTAAANEEANAIVTEAKQRAKAVRQQARERQQEAQSDCAAA